jgi:hypothetical protein
LKVIFVKLSLGEEITWSYTNVLDSCRAVRERLNQVKKLMAESGKEAYG